MKDVKRTSLPGVPWKNVWSIVLRLVVTGVPLTITREFLKDFATSGSSSVAQLFFALQFVLLIDESHRPTTYLERLVQETEDQQFVLREIFNLCYTPLLSDLGDLFIIDHEQLEEAFQRHYQVENDVRRKAISFFVHMSQAAGISLSPLIRTANNPLFGRRIAPQPAPLEEINLHPQSPVEHVPMYRSERTSSAFVCCDQAKKKTKTITFPKGGGITFSYTVVIASLKKQDRMLMLDLIDCFRRIEQRGELTQENFQEEEIKISFSQGEFVTVSYSIDLLEIDEQDRLLLFDLIDRFHPLEQKAMCTQEDAQELSVNGRVHTKAS